MSRSNYDKLFYVDVGTSIVAVRCASNHDVIVRYDHVRHPHTLELANDVCDRMNKEVEIGKPPRNCDVGSAKEQGERYKAYCRKHFTPGRFGGSCHRCPLKDRRGWSCQIAWAQMSYNEGD